MQPAPAGSPCGTHLTPARCPPSRRQARKWFKGPVRNVDTGNKTETLAEAAMRGELDEGEAGWGDEAGEGAPAKAETSSAEGEPKEQFVVA